MLVPRVALLVLDHVAEDLDQVRVELGAGPAPDLGEGAVRSRAVE